MLYTKEELACLSRKELQKLCKQFQIKANKKNCELVDGLLNYFSNLQTEEQNLEKELLKTEELKVEKPINVSAWVSDDDEENNPPNQMRNDLIKEVERRAQEKITKIPRFKTDQDDVSGFLSPASKIMFGKKHNKEFEKVDSIDVYMLKKKRRAEERFVYTKKLKLDAEKTLNRMKATHNTPGGVKSNDMKRKSLSKTPLWHAKSPMFKKSSLKIDKEVSFNNFVSKLKSPKSMFTRTSPRLNALKERNVKFPQQVVTKLNKSVIDIKSPAFSVTNTSAKKTPKKFDLQASLKKRLSYKPHGGKIKEKYFADGKIDGASYRGESNKSLVEVAQQKVSVKELTKTVSTRDKRRAATSKKRDDKRDKDLAKRRGIVC